MPTAPPGRCWCTSHPGPRTRCHMCCDAARTIRHGGLDPTYECSNPGFSSPEDTFSSSTPNPLKSATHDRPLESRPTDHPKPHGSHAELVLREAPSETS